MLMVDRYTWTKSDMERSTDGFWVTAHDYDALAARLRAECEAELERERLRLAACGTAALGYFNGCNPEYDSASLRDVLRLRARLAEAERLLRGALAGLCPSNHREIEAYMGIRYTADSAEPRETGTL